MPLSLAAANPDPIGLLEPGSFTTLAALPGTAEAMRRRKLRLRRG